MKYLSAFILVFSFAASGFSQAYNSAIGLRLGSGIGISAQHRIADKTTLEGIASTKFKADEFKLTLLAKQHFPILFKRFNVYAGGGLHKGWYTGNQTPVNDQPVEAIGNPFGVTLVGGAEISLGRFNISYDYKPGFNFKGGEKAFNNETAISVRYILWERPTKLDKWRKSRKKKKKK